MAFREQRSAITAALGVKDIRNLWLAQALSEIGDWASRLALAVVVYNRTESALMSTTVFAVSMLPYIFSPWLTAIAMRWPLRTTLLGMDAIRAVAFIIIAIPGLPVPALFVLVFIAALASPPFEACKQAALAEASGSKHMGGSLTLSELTLQSSQVLGFALAGALLTTLGSSLVLVLNAATFAVSFVLILPVQVGRSPGQKQKATQILAGPLRKLVSRGIIRQAVLLAIVGSFVDAAVITLLPALTISENLPLWILSGLTLLSPLVGVVATMFVRTSGSPSQLLHAGMYFILVPCVLCTVFLVLAWTLPEAWLMPLLVAAIASYGLTIAAGPPIYVLVLDLLDDSERAPATALIQPVFMGAQVVGAVLAGATASFIPILLVQAVGAGVGVGYGLWVYLRPEPARELRVESESA